MFGTRLRSLRREKQLTQTDLARLLGVTQQAVGKWENEKSFPDSETLLKIAGFFEVSLDFLLGRKEEELALESVRKGIVTKRLPIIGSVRAGYGKLAQEEYLGEELAEIREPYEYFYLLVQGDSMEPRIQHGDLALVRRQSSLEHGDLGVVIYQEETGTLKRFLRKGRAVMLQPFNPAYPAMLLSGAELEQLFVVGKVIETKTRW